MPEWPGLAMPLSFPAVLTPWSMFGSIPFVHRAGAASQVWPTANRAYYYPIRVAQTVLLQRAFWFNGATVSGNADCGMYDRVGTKLLSTGSTAQAGISAVQSVDVTDTPIGPGVFYLALVLDNATGTILMYDPVFTLLAKFAGMHTQATAFALPATATFASVAASQMAIFGFTCRPVT